MPPDAAAAAPVAIGQQGCQEKAPRFEKIVALFEKKGA
jgi:hypothetical protein